MREERTAREKKVDDAFYAYLKGFGSVFDLIGKNVGYSGSYTGRVDILRLDMDRRYVEFREVPRGTVSQQAAYQSLARSINRLEEDWSCSIGDVDEDDIRYLDGSPSIEGKLYYEDEDRWKLLTAQFEEFSIEVFGQKILEEEPRVDTGKLDI